MIRTVSRFCVGILLSLWVVCVSSVFAEEFLPDSVALEIIEDFRRVSGITVDGKSAANDGCDGDECVVKCGTPARMIFFESLDRIDPRLLGNLRGLSPARPDLPLSYRSPAGRFTLHYSKTGIDAVYQSNVDTDADGVPDFIESVAIIADSVYEFEITTLGYPKPPIDSLAIEGGDATYDIYLTDFTAASFGQTAQDPETDSGAFDFTASSYMQLENDYQELERYRDRPLDAIRVTVAHEYFHAIQFGIDNNEFDVVTGIARPYWIEMSAVWMEEEAYDNINDYYAYLVRNEYFSSPRRSLQQFLSGSDLRPYAAGVFPIFLSQRFDRDIIRRIWNRCVTGGPNILSALNEEIFASSAGTSSLADALAEFGLWNYFTGQYASDGPGNYGYEEAENYPSTPVSAIIQESVFPFFRQFTDTARQAQYNGVTYIQLKELQELATSSYRCNDTNLSGVCIDSTPVFQLGAVFGVNPLPQVRWGIGVIYQLQTPLDSHTVEVFSVNDAAVTVIEFENPDNYRSITLAIAPASIDPTRYRQLSPPNFLAPFGYGTTSDTNGPNPSLISRPAAVLYPFPNPAVISEMNGANMTFRFVGPTNEASFPEYASAFLSVDFYTASGDYVATSTGSTPAEDRLGVYRTAEYETTWNMTNQSGEPVAGGVYLAVAKLYVDASRTTLITEAKQKLLIVR